MDKIKEFLKSNKKFVMLVVTGLLGIIGGYIGLDENAQYKVLELLSYLIPE